jgi:hypothetical protein
MGSGGFDVDDGKPHRRKFKPMNRSRAAFAAVMCAAGTLGWAQDDEEPESDGYLNTRRGIEFAVNFGLHKPNNKAATAFFSGAGGYDLGDNIAWLNTIEERLQIDQPNSVVWSQVMNATGLEAGEFRYIELPLEMRYQPGRLLGLQTLYFFNPEAALVLHVDMMTGLKSQGGWNIVSSDAQQGMGSERRRTYGIFSEEDRLGLSLGYRTAAYIYDDLSWVFEGGASMLGTRILRNYVVIENQTYDLLTASLGPGGIFQGPNSALVGIGYGGYLGAGFELFFEKGGNLQAMLRVAREEVVMGSYAEPQWNGSVYLAWVIPPVLDYARVSF